MDKKFNNEAELQAWQDENLEKFGFYVHYVSGDMTTPTGTNYHTHGLAERFEHPDIQIIIPLDPRTAHTILHGIVDSIRDGKRYRPQVLYRKIVQKFPVKFINAVEGERQVLRMILPEPSGAVSEKKMTNELYKKQYGQTGLQ